MSTLEKRLEDPEYKAWVKCGLCLNYVKSGLEEFANERSQTAHNIVITEVVKTNPSNEVCPAAVDVRQRRGCWQMRCCNNCDEYVKQIEKLKAPGFSFKNDNWKNSNIQLWPTDAWEMMKVFMNKGQKAFQNKAQDSDLSAIVNFIDHCHIPKVDIANQTNIRKVRDARNETMHSTSMKMRIADFQMFTGSMIDLLEDGQVLCHKKEAIDAVLKIKEIQGADFSITKYSEFALLTDKTEQVLRETQLLYEEVDGLKAEYEDIKSLLDDKNNALGSLLQDETREREAHLSQLQDQMKKKQQQIKELSSELASLKDHVRHDKELYRKMDIRLKNTEIALDKTNTEVKQVTQSHEMLKREVDNIKKLLNMRQDVDLQQPENSETKTTKEQVSQLSNHITSKPSADETHKLQNLQREYDNLKKCMEDLKAHYAHSNEQILNKELHSKNKMLKQEIDVLHQEVNKNLSGNSATDTRQELIKSKEKITQLENEVKILKENVACQKQEMTESELQSFKKTNESLEKDNIYLVEENERLTTELNNLQQYVNQNPKMSITCILDEKQKLTTDVEYYKKKAMKLKMHYETLKQDKSKIDDILHNVTIANETLKQDKSETDNILQYVTNENETLEIQVQKLSLKNSDLENDIIISKKKLSNSYSKLEITEIELATERNLRKNLDAKQQALKHKIEQINEQKQEINRENSEKQHALERQIQILEIENKDLKENISKINWELEKQKKEAQENYTHGQQLKDFESCLSSSSDVGAETESRSRQNPESTRESLDDQHKLYATVASGISEKGISDLQQNFDQEHQLRNTAENDKKASQKTHEDLSKKIEELQKQVQTEKSSREAFEHQNKLSAAAASETSKKCISDLQQKFDQEHKLRNAAENDLKASQETNEDLPKRIEELQKQVQTGKSSRKALEDQHKLSAAAASETSEKCISDMKVVSSSIVDVKLKDDRYLPYITGCVFVSTGQLVLCDYGNYKIMLLSSDLKVEDSLDLQEREPWDISAASSSAVVITLPKERQLQFIQLSPELGHGQLIQLDKECWRVCVVGEEIYVGCGSLDFGDNDGEVRIYNTKGVVKRRLCLPTEPGSSYMFSCPEYLTVNACSGRIYVSDLGRDTLTCLSEDGSIIYQYSDRQLRTPQGLYVDADDYVIVCGYRSDNLQMISPSGEKVSTLLSEKDGIMGPRSVAYRPTDGVLVIGCHDDNNLHVFKLSH